MSVSISSRLQVGTTVTEDSTSKSFISILKITKNPDNIISNVVYNSTIENFEPGFVTTKTSYIGQLKASARQVFKNSDIVDEPVITGFRISKCNPPVNNDPIGINPENEIIFFNINHKDETRYYYSIGNITLKSNPDDSLIIESTDFIKKINVKTDSQNLNEIWCPFAPSITHEDLSTTNITEITTYPELVQTITTKFQILYYLLCVNNIETALKTFNIDLLTKLLKYMIIDTTGLIKQIKEKTSQPNSVEYLFGNSLFKNSTPFVKKRIFQILKYIEAKSGKVYNLPESFISFIDYPKLLEICDGNYEDIKMAHALEDFYYIGQNQSSSGGGNQENIKLTKNMIECFLDLRDEYEKDSPHPWGFVRINYIKNGQDDDFTQTNERYFLRAISDENYSTLLIDAVENPTSMYKKSETASGSTIVANDAYTANDEIEYDAANKKFKKGQGGPKQKHVFGPFKKIYGYYKNAQGNRNKRNALTNEDIANDPQMRKIVDELVKPGKIVSINLYGASGAGKTSSGIYFNKGQTEAERTGILIQLCNKMQEKSPVIYLSKKELCANITGEFDGCDNVDAVDKLLKFKWIATIQEYAEIFGPDNLQYKNMMIRKYGGASFVPGYYCVRPETGEENIIDPTQIPIKNIERINTLHQIEIKKGNNNEYNFYPIDTGVNRAFYTNMLGRPLGYVSQFLVDSDRNVKATTNNPNSSRSHVILFILFILVNQGKSALMAGDFAGVEPKFGCEMPSVIEAFANLVNDNDPTRKYYFDENQNISAKRQNIPNFGDTSKIMELYEINQETLQNIVITWYLCFGMLPIHTSSKPRNPEAFANIEINIDKYVKLWAEGIYANGSNAFDSHIELLKRDVDVRQCDGVNQKFKDFFTIQDAKPENDADDGLSARKQSLKEFFDNQIKNCVGKTNFGKNSKITLDFVFTPTIKNRKFNDIMLNIEERQGNYFYVMSGKVSPAKNINIELNFNIPDANQPVKIEGIFPFYNNYTVLSNILDKEPNLILPMYIFPTLTGDKKVQINHPNRTHTIYLKSIIDEFILNKMLSYEFLLAYNINNSTKDSVVKPPTIGVTKMWYFYRTGNNNQTNGSSNLVPIGIFTLTKSTEPSKTNKGLYIFRIKLTVTFIIPSKPNDAETTFDFNTIYSEKYIIVSEFFDNIQSKLISWNEDWGSITLSDTDLSRQTSGHIDNAIKNIENKPEDLIFPAYINEINYYGEDNSAQRSNTQFFLFCKATLSQFAIKESNRKKLQQRIINLVKKDSNFVQKFKEVMAGYKTKIGLQGLLKQKCNSRTQEGNRINEGLSEMRKAIKLISSVKNNGNPVLPLSVLGGVDMFDKKLDEILFNEHIDYNSLADEINKSEIFHSIFKFAIDNQIVNFKIEADINSKYKMICENIIIILFCVINVSKKTEATDSMLKMQYLEINELRNIHNELVKSNGGQWDDDTILNTTKQVKDLIFGYYKKMDFNNIQTQQTTVCPQEIIDAKNLIGNPTDDANLINCQEPFEKEDDNKGVAELSLLKILSKEGDFEKYTTILSEIIKAFDTLNSTTIIGTLKSMSELINEVKNDLEQDNFKNQIDEHSRDIVKLTSELSSV